MAVTPLAFDDILKDVPPGAWAAIDHSTVVAYGPDLQQVIREAEEKGIETPLIVRVPEHAQNLIL